MKGLRLVTLIMAAAITAGITLCIGLTLSYYHSESSENILLISDISGTVREHWGDLDALEGRDFGTAYIVFDKSGRALYRSPDSSDMGSDIRLNDVIRSGAVSVPLMQGEEFLGTLALTDIGRSSFDTVRKRIVWVLIAMGAVMLLAVTGYAAYVHLRIVKPFRQMESFAGRIAQGRLDDGLLQDKGELFGAFTQSFDIMREELKASRERENALKLRERELVATLSHDLRTPLTGIKLLSELLAVKTEDGYVREKLGIIRSKAVQMDGIVEDLLSASIDDVSPTLTLSNETSALVHELIAEQDHNRWVREESLPECLIRTDRRALGRVIGNVIGNAYKYGQSPIRVSYAVEGKYLRAELADSGSGVAREELELITGKFYRTQAAKETTEEGNGLGLFIARSLMEKMGGRLLCANNGGLAVRLYIPLS